MDRFTITPTEELVQLFERMLDQKFVQHFAKQTPSAETHLLSRKQAANFLGISLPTLNEWSKNELVLAHKVGTKVYYKKAELEQSLKQIKTR